MKIDKSVGGGTDSGVALFRSWGTYIDQDGVTCGAKFMAYDNAWSAHITVPE